MAPTPVERVRGEHPTDEVWRADGLAGSRHTRWIDELREPLDDADPERARVLCAQVTRAALRDFAPALILLDEAERARVQAVAAYALVVFDFAAQAGLEGERLSQLNRLEFDLEATLEGDPPGQPVFVALARAHSAEPWPRPAFDRITAAARARILEPRPATSLDLDRDADNLARALCETLTRRPPGELVTLAAVALRLQSLLDLAEATRRHRQRLPTEELPDDWVTGEHDATRLHAAVARECARLTERLASASPGGDDLSSSQRRAGRYVYLATRRLLGRAARLGAELLERRPALGPLERIGLLCRARLGL